MHKRRHVLASLLAALLLAGCSSQPEKPAESKQKEAEKPPEAVTGQSAFWKMFMAARTWAPDVQVLNLRNIPLEQVKSEPGKSGAWEATFVASSKGQSKIYTFSVVEAGGNLHKDVFAGLGEAWTGPRGQQRPFPVQALKVDSDKAYQTAVEVSKDYIKKNPDKPINFVLEQTPRHPEATWRVIWGESIARSNYSVIVGASSGKYLEKLR
jgi:hypothetical protein